MAQFIEDHQRAAGDVAVEALSVVGWNQAVAPTPNDEGRQFQFRDAMGQTARLSLPEPLDKRSAISFALGDLDGAIHQFRRHIARISKDVAQTLFNEAAGKRVLQHPTNPWYPR